jgi:hypothetical protein
VYIKAHTRAERGCHQATFTQQPSIARTRIRIHVFFHSIGDEISYQMEKSLHLHAGFASE